MRGLWHNTKTFEEEDGDYENISSKLQQNLGELECEEAIIQDKERFVIGTKIIPNK